MVKVVSSVAGVNAAQMTFVVGTDGGGLEHPNWAENLKLAAAVQQDLCEDYPTLMRPITVRNSRYNQHVTTGTLWWRWGRRGTPWTRPSCPPGSWASPWRRCSWQKLPARKLCRLVLPEGPGGPPQVHQLQD